MSIFKTWSLSPEGSLLFRDPFFQDFRAFHPTILLCKHLRRDPVFVCTICMSTTEKEEGNDTCVAVGGGKVERS